MENKNLQSYLSAPISESTNLELYNAALALVKEASAARGYNEGKKLYYISAEFLIGKLLSNNLINLGLYDSVKAELEKAGKSLADLEELESEPSLGNGELRKAGVLFADSCATLGLPACGVWSQLSLRSLQAGVFRENKQKEEPNEWLVWEKKAGSGVKRSTIGLTSEVFH